MKKYLKASCILKRNLVILLLFIAVSPLGAQTNSTAEYQLKAAFLYNFTRFVEWPENKNSETEPFIIGILGNDPFGNYIDELVKGERIGLHPILIKRYDSVNESFKCNILFIHSDEAIRIKDLIPAINKQNILTVSDASNFVKWGGTVRFFKEDNKVRLQINMASVKVSQLSISSKLLSLAKIYEGR